VDWLAAALLEEDAALDPLLVTELARETLADARAATPTSSSSLRAAGADRVTATRRRSCAV